MLLYQYRIFKKLDGRADMIILDSYSHDRSRFNDIEHLWSPLSDALTGVVCSPCATGDAVAPCNLRVAAVTAEERVQKEAEAFDRALSEVPAFWRKKKFNTHVITTSSVAANQSNNHFTAAGHEMLLKTLSASKKAIAFDPKMLAILIELKDALLHLDRQCNFAAILKCSQDKPCAWCSTRPSTFSAHFLHKHKMKFPAQAQDEISRSVVVDCAP